MSYLYRHKGKVKIEKNLIFLWRGALDHMTHSTINIHPKNRPKRKEEKTINKKIFNFDFWLFCSITMKKIVIFEIWIFFLNIKKNSILFKSITVFGCNYAYFAQKCTKFAKYMQNMHTIFSKVKSDLSLYCLSLRVLTKALLLLKLVWGCVCTQCLVLSESQ